MIEVTTADITRFYEKTKYNYKTGCLEWTACRMKAGHGQFSMRHKHILAHRWVMQLALKRTLAPHEVVRHKVCNNPPCVSLAHLAVGTQGDNIWDTVASGRHNNGSKTQCKHGHPYDDENTYWMPSGGRDCKRCIRRRGREYKARKRQSCE